VCGYAPRAREDRGTWVALRGGRSTLPLDVRLKSFGPINSTDAPGGSAQEGANHA
jgi:hypothetical protein